MPAKKKRARRTAEQMIADLEAKIAEVKRRAERKKIAKDPALRQIKAAVRSVDKAMELTQDGATRKALEESRSTLAACLSLHGSEPQAASATMKPRLRAGRKVDAEAVLDYLRANPGSRGEQIADALGTDTRSLRPTLQALRNDGQVTSEGKGRATNYSLA
jgi:hypothetical protein